MAERLTEYFENGAYTEKQNIIDVSDKVKFFDNGCVMGKAIDKLAQLEDIMEKYGIESVEELSKIFSYLSGRFINSVYSLKHKFDGYEDKIKYLANKKGQYYEELYETKQDRDTWKRACELACDVLRDINYKIYNEDRIDFENTFYQQAKTEVKNETT